MQKMRKKSGVKKQTKADFLRSWGMGEYQYSNLRYKHPPEKGVYWYFFSLFIRKRDVEEFGTCISCGKTITVETCDAGHFMPAGSCGRDLLFDELNVNAECSHCNAWDETHLLGYAEGLDRRYGVETATELRARRELYRCGLPVKDWKKEEYSRKILEIKEHL